MSCSEFDIKAYLLEELHGTEREQVKSHLRTCLECGEEFEALAGTRTALLSVPDEEPPRRIAFVSDKVFEPKWWQRIWQSGPQLGFVSASLLAVAILVHAFVPAQQLPPPVQTAVASQTELDKAVTAAVTQAVAQAEERHKAELRKVLDERIEAVERRHDMVVTSMQALYQERIDHMRRASTTRVRNARYDAGIYQ